MQAYSLSIESKELENSAALVHNDFYNLKELDADDLALQIYQLGQKNLEDLSDLAMNSQTLTTLPVTLKVSLKNRSSPTVVYRHQRKESFQQASFDKADTAIQKMLDNHIDSFRKKDRQAYQDARAVIWSTRKTETLINTDTAV